MVPPKANILLVDDQPGNLLVLEAVLQGLGQNLVKANSAAQALKCLLNDEFALILMDAQMPVMDGFEAATLIRQREKTRFTPIIFITAYELTGGQVFKGYSIGAVDFLFKPVIPEILRSKVSVFVDLYLKTGRFDQLSVPLGAIEESVALLRRLPAVIKDSEAAATAAQLALRVGRLRDVLEASGGG